MNIQSDIDLFPHSTLRIRAVADYFAIARTADDLIEGWRFAKKKKVAFRVLGGGSNVAIVQRRVPGLVVKNAYMKREVVRKTNTYVDLLVSSGYPVTKLINENIRDGYAGLEYHLGLPGTVGGAIYMNSKWTRPECYFGDPLIGARLLTDSAKIKEVKREYFKFRYDYSILHKTGEILLEAIFRLRREDPAPLEKRARKSFDYRKKTQPTGVATAGCFFQNINVNEMQKIGATTKSAGSLIDKAGLKGYEIGNFIISNEHANFVINRGEGDPEKLKVLIETVKRRVKEKFDIDLKEEVVVV